MTDDKRPDMEWPSEDLARRADKPESRPEVEWPSEDVAKVAKAKPAPAPLTPEPAPPAPEPAATQLAPCLLYTSDAADERVRV